ncbi:sensor histidine kinase [Hydrocarboniphaga effusa]|jgi:two-component system sensor histidine kinase TctE|uniref:sensor histidine kinase n=1 Tax=Hydrocarboniphaga effusa TaxID=243629 RepID=UPI0035AE7D09
MSRPEPRHSLRSGLLFALVGPLSAVLVLGGAVSYGLANYFADSVYDGWLFDSASALALEVERTDDGPFVDLPAPTQRLFEWDETDTTYFRISGERKGLIAGRTQPMPDVIGDVDDYHGALLYDGEIDDEPVRIARIELPASRYGEIVHVEVAETMRKRSGLASAILASTLLPQLLLIGVTAAVVRRAIRRGLLPLHSLAQRLEARSHRELSPIADEGVPEEVLPLTRSLNDLLARLQSAVTAQQRFIAHAAHQLRTPLTAIKLQAEAVIRESRQDEIAPLLGALRASIERAARLTNQLLSLARAEPDSSGDRPFRRIDLVALVQETGADWAPRAFARGLDMQFACEDEHRPLWIDGDADLIRDALNNLIDNAINYHPGPGTLRLALRRRPQPEILVEDDGPGIEADQRDTMLRRFVRGTRGEGSGLGLAIAQEIAHAHGGELLLEDGPQGKGLTVRLLLGRELGNRRRDT